MYHCDGAVESREHATGKNPSSHSGSGRLDKKRLAILEKAVGDPELLKQKNFGPGETTLVLQKGGMTKSFGATDIKKFPGASGRLLRAVLKAQGEPGF